MLQQTRVAVAVERYGDFLRRFPTVEKLSRADSSDVLAAWSGLGYYRRARALHAAAQFIMKNHGGELPRQADALATLPGIGRYTAAAIASIAFDEPVAVVDGNVERVLVRFYGQPQRDSWIRASELLDRKRPGDHNQAMMELGATVCLPTRPLCTRCPIRRYCTTRGEFPMGKRVRRKKQRVAYALSIQDGLIFLVQRPANVALMPGMWELPPTQLRRSPVPLLKLCHSITNTDYVVFVFPRRAPARAKHGQWFSRAAAERLPLTGLTRKVLQKLAALTPAEWLNLALLELHFRIKS